MTSFSRYEADRPSANLTKLINLQHSQLATESYWLVSAIVAAANPIYLAMTTGRMDYFLADHRCPPESTGWKRFLMHGFTVFELRYDFKGVEQASRDFTQQLRQPPLNIKQVLAQFSRCRSISQLVSKSIAVFLSIPKPFSIWGIIENPPPSA